MSSHRNQATAFVDLLERVMRRGERTTVRGYETRELRHVGVQIERPLERYVPVPSRRGDVFASIAETVWVLAGRNDVDFLSEYLPRAGEFSDDGRTWRAGYGPRLRNWNGIDQLAEVVAILSEESTSRRGSIVLFDPAEDFQVSKDIPCTNWLNVSIRHGRLDIDVAVRSNDLFWGFSGINVFEWSVMQEMLAFWLDSDVGGLAFWISSLHVYERHYARALEIMRGAQPIALGVRTPAQRNFATPFSELEGTFSDWFAIEGMIRAGGIPAAEIRAFKDPLLRDFLWMLAARKEQQRVDADAAQAWLDEITDPELVRAAREFFERRPGGGAVHRASAEGEILKLEIAELHRAKTSTYGDSWKRHGEVGSILPNIDRKIDRLRNFDRIAPEDAESASDTAVDLFVYALKYRTFLAEQQGLGLPHGVSRWSDGVEGFEYLLNEYDSFGPRESSDRAVSDVMAAGAAVRTAVTKQLPIADRVRLAEDLAASAWDLVVVLLTRRSST
ncbi:thymidylate synthase [Microbacterium sulfonylureivorans]|uniref:thymidylate synthase n=1 Tax=Microbacterium sulfonylureivorans TaxID=2486854 RepID=UPI000FDC4030|nr:thymidylate synthase [Microbacterium sulfonylureivorans]